MPLALPENTIEVWVIDLAGGSDEQIEQESDLLSPDERERAARFRFPVDRDRFIRARVALRRILASYHDIGPAEIGFEYSHFGKPTLGKPQSDIRFNTSHAGGTALVACTRGMEVGVDIECISRNVEATDLAERFFSPQENAKLRSLPADLQRLAFFRCWTCKEAYVKAVGKGLSLGLDQFDVSAVLASSTEVMSRQNHGFVLGDFFLWALGSDTVDGYRAAAVARSATKVSLQIRQFDEIDVKN